MAPLLSSSDLEKSVPIEFDEVKNVIDAIPPDDAGSWVTQEFRGLNLSDKRLNRRLVRTAEVLAKSPLSPINEACGSWASTRGAYRLFDNDKADSKEILRPHREETIRRMSAYGKTVLAVQDTVFFSYGKHPKTRGLGPIGKGESTKDRGLIAHHALAFTTSGLPLGILSQQIWARPEVLDETKEEKIERVQLTCLEEKESSKWLLALRESVAASAASQARVVTLADRESDFFEFMTEAEELGALYVIRARIDRKLVADESDDCRSVSEALLGTEVQGTISLSIPSNGSRKARTAQVSVRFAEVMIQAPQKRGHAKDSGSSLPLPVTVISAQELDPPKGTEALSWVLFTNVGVKSYEQALEKINWYAKRWGIETWHKVLKSGCKVEECLLETADRLKRFLTLFSIIGCRLLYLTHLARVSPELPSTAAFGLEEIEALLIRVDQKLPDPNEEPSLRQIVRKIGQLGGHLGRKCDGEPGIVTIWRGLMRLHECVEMLLALRRASPRVKDAILRPGI